ncbi:MAG: hypothetical protein IKV63_01120 [Clostridia bacterium]|nr:hypothetical protein [Clostridia bacterium]
MKYFRKRFITLLLATLLIFALVYVIRGDMLPIYAFNRYKVSFDNGETWRQMDETEEAAFDEFHSYVSFNCTLVPNEIKVNGQTQYLYVKSPAPDDSIMVVDRANIIDYRQDARYYITENEGKYELFLCREYHNKKPYVYTIIEDFSPQIEELYAKLKD